MFYINKTNKHFPLYFNNTKTFFISISKTHSIWCTNINPSFRSSHRLIQTCFLAGVVWFLLPVDEKNVLWSSIFRKQHKTQRQWELCSPSWGICFSWVCLCMRLTLFGQLNGPAHHKWTWAEVQGSEIVSRQWPWNMKYVVKHKVKSQARG